ncbi:hypothetical protein ACFOWU_05715 [Epilithonimonas zeae]|uniref:Uncharacterized protein n=1 Tax=Epilithonimonas zeae TaxID=1416779 RepID=A0A1N6FD87_9FLAO|nr:hypothetical protein [Epilithonimonas zeae]SIN93217.1 hypothetical protein SAMN05444409_1205 [Epilithonimonas zeae]
MKTKNRGDWELWKASNSRHQFQILIVNIAVILSVFVVAAIIQFS